MSVIACFCASPEIAAREHNLSGGVIDLAIRLFCVFRSGWFILTFPALTFIYGVIILFAGLTKIQWAADFLFLNPAWSADSLKTIVPLLRGLRPASHSSTGPAQSCHPEPFRICGLLFCKETVGFA